MCIVTVFGFNFGLHCRQDFNTSFWKTSRNSIVRCFYIGVWFERQVVNFEFLFYTPRF